MAIKTIIKKNTYFDSVSLMAISTKANGIEGVRQANLAMGTEKNKEILHNTGLYTPEAEPAGRGDLMIVLDIQEGYDPAKVEDAVLETLVRKQDSGEDSGSDYEFSSVEAACQGGHANLAVVSINGAYAARAARKALDKGLHVMIFSDNVSLEEEIELKSYAHEKGLLVMGPDCGTAILNGKGLCFANAVRRGHIGIVAASGTGAQEVSCQVHGFGGGISQLIGTGGRDLSREVGGIMMLDGLQALAEDENTSVIILVSKLPHPAVAEKIYARVRSIEKPVVIAFIGGKQEEIEACGAIYAETTKRAALKAVLLSGVPEETINKHALNLPLIQEVKAKLQPQQKYIRGLFCGGTVCQEVYGLIQQKYPNVYSNIAHDKKYVLGPNDASREHTLFDLGDDAFTDGRPHPMIDPSLRLDWIIREAQDPEVGVIVLDIILGYGSHPDPAGITLPAIRKAKELAAARGQHLEILALVLGTELDSQNFDAQCAKLEAAGVTIASSVENTGLLSRGFVEKEEV